MNIDPPVSELLAALANRLGPRGFSTDPEALAPWLVDWRGRVKGGALAMLSPETREEVVDIVRLAAAARVPIVPQGGNTSMVAGATPMPGMLLLSLRRMRAIRAISAEDNSVVAEAGVILSDLHDAAAAVGRRFPLSLAAKGSATVGGLISTNAGGTQVLRFGTMRAQVTGIEAVLPDGGLFEGLSALRKDNRGYDLRELLIGAEGTLGIVTAASLRLVPAVTARAVAWVGLASPEEALVLLQRLQREMGDSIEGFELLPRDALELVLRHIPGTRNPLVGNHEWHVLIEATGGDAAERLGVALADAAIVDAVIAGSDTQAEALWRLRESISESERIDGISVKHDISVPVSAMPGFIRTTMPRIMAAFPGARPLPFGHLGDGNIHFNVRNPEGSDAQGWFDAHHEAVNRLVHDLVTESGGSLSAEHGIGLLKIDEFARVGDPVRLGALRAIKHALDPLGIMNPGKLVPLASGGGGA